MLVEYRERKAHPREERRTEKNIKQIEERLIGLQCLNTENVQFRQKLFFARPILIFNFRTINSSRKGAHQILRKMYR